TIATTPGANYTVSWWMQSDGGTPNQFQASWNGSVIFNQVNIPSQSYQLYTFTETATSALTTIQFGFRNDPGWLALDDVSVTCANETTVVAPANATIVTQASTTSPNPGLIFLHDSATVSGYYPTGSVTFTLHRPDGTTFTSETDALVPNLNPQTAT